MSPNCLWSVFRLTQRYRSEGMQLVNAALNMGLHCCLSPARTRRSGNQGWQVLQEKLIFAGNVVNDLWRKDDVI